MRQLNKTAFGNSFAPGLVERALWVRPGAAAAVTMIAEAGFSLDFYRAFVRNGFEAPEDLQPLRRWTVAPRVYVQTTEASGQLVDPAVVALVRDLLEAGVPAWTSGQLALAAFETGPEARDEVDGWIRVLFERAPDEAWCGRSFVGADPGRIRFNLDRCGCGGVPPHTVLHELGHALGFWHTPSGVMVAQNPGGCVRDAVTDLERAHAWIAYQRPVGNLDVDRDPRPGTTNLLVGRAGRIEVIDP